MLKVWLLEKKTYDEDLLACALTGIYSEKKVKTVSNQVTFCFTDNRQVPT